MILPGQFFELMGRHGLTSEQRLMLAVLADAINILRGQSTVGDRHKRQLAAEARNWVAASDPGCPLAFERVCEALEIDAGALRQHLMMTRAPGPSGARIKPARLRLKEASRAQHLTVNRVRHRPGHRSRPLRLRHS